jgi:hypothetical protein
MCNKLGKDGNLQYMLMAKPKSDSDTNSESKSKNKWDFFESTTIFYDTDDDKYKDVYRIQNENSPMVAAIPLVFAFTFRVSIRV